VSAVPSYLASEAGEGPVSVRDHFVQVAGGQPLHGLPNKQLHIEESRSRLEFGGGRLPKISQIINDVLCLLFSLFFIELFCNSVSLSVTSHLTLPTFIPHTCMKQVKATLITLIQTFPSELFKICTCLQKIVANRSIYIKPSVSLHWKQLTFTCTSEIQYLPV
jgi:hypothetical protein